MRCQEIENLLSAYADGELEDGERQVVLSHLKTCQGCLGVLDQISAIKNTFAMPSGFDVSAELAQKLDDIATKFSEVYAAKRLATQSHERTTVMERSVAAGKRAAIIRRPSLVAAIAASVIILVSGGVLFTDAESSVFKLTQKPIEWESGQIESASFIDKQNGIKLELSFEPAKQDYVAGNPCFATILLENQSDRDLVLGGNGNLLEVVVSDGVSETIWPDPLPGSYTRELKSGQENGMKTLFIIDKPGIYKVHARLSGALIRDIGHTSYDLGLKPKLQTRPITISVK